MSRVKIFNYQIDALRMHEVINKALVWASHDSYPCRFVVTPNVNHTVLLQRNAEFLKAYKAADLVLADGFPLVIVSKLIDKPLPERVAGSELIPKLFEAASKERKIKAFLLGAAEGVGEQAAIEIQSKYAGVEVVGTFSPEYGFEKSDAQSHEIIEKINSVEPDILIVGLGAPKQELWIHKHREQIRAKVAFCVGATIDFMAGRKSQAPVFMRRYGLEWLYRMLSEPRRLTSRYAHDARLFPQLVWVEWQKQRHKST